MEDPIINLNKEKNIEKLESKVNLKKLFLISGSIIFVILIIFNISNLSSKQITSKPTRSLLEATADSLEADGYASLNGGTVGGRGGKSVTVTKYTDFKNAVNSNDPMIVIVKGTIKTTDGGDRCINVKGNKTIMGADKSATIYGGICMTNVKNVIVYNLNIQGTYPNDGPADCIGISNNATNIWIHHCTIWDARDGNLDIKDMATYITVSYCKFYYTDTSNPHRLNALIGSGGGGHKRDFGFLKTTYHHNWFEKNIQERMPRIMYGEVHIYNNVYTSNNNNYCIGFGSYASIIVENNYFKDVKSPIRFLYDVYAYVLQKNNVFTNTSGNTDGTADGKMYGSTLVTEGDNALLEMPKELKSVPYKYTAEDANKILDIVKAEAGPQ